MPRSFGERKSLAKAARGYYLFCEPETVDLAIQPIGTVRMVAMDLMLGPDVQNLYRPACAPLLERICMNQTHSVT
jgi:hypothetical protein